MGDSAGTDGQAPLALNLQNLDVALCCNPAENVESGHGALLSAAVATPADTSPGASPCAAGVEHGGNKSFSENESDHRDVVEFLRQKGLKRIAEQLADELDLEEKSDSSVREARTA